MGAVDKKTQMQANRNQIAPLMQMSGRGSIEVEGKVSWGGSEGVNGNVSVSAQVHDDHGSYVEIKAEQGSSGEGSVSISAGHEPAIDEEK